jgi:hypothetical protein
MPDPGQIKKEIQHGERGLVNSTCFNQVSYDSLTLCFCVVGWQMCLLGCMYKIFEGKLSEGVVDVVTDFGSLIHIELTSLYVAADLWLMDKGKRSRVTPSHSIFKSPFIS